MTKLSKSLILKCTGTDVGGGCGDGDGDGGSDDGSGKWLSTAVLCGITGVGVFIIIAGGGTCLLLIFLFKKKTKTKVDGKYIVTREGLIYSSLFLYVHIILLVVKMGAKL